MVANGAIEPLSASGVLQVPVGSAIFNNVSVQGFDFGTWVRSDAAGVGAALKAVSGLVAGKKVSLQAKVYAQKDFMAAVDAVASTGAPAVLKI